MERGHGSAHGSALIAATILVETLCVLEVLDGEDIVLLMIEFEQTLEHVCERERLGAALDLVNRVHKLDDLALLVEHAA